jgi:hypothetical protein
MLAPAVNIIEDLDDAGGQRETSVLLLVDFQSKLMPAIDGGPSIVANARRLDAAIMLDVPVLITEQNAAGLGDAAGAERTSTASRTR